MDKQFYNKMTSFSIMLATIMQTLDMTIANVALPHMQGSLNATQEQVTWVLTSYIIASAIMTAPAGILSVKFGRKRLFLICILGFTAASFLCGAATSLAAMVFFRVLQGVFGAALIPLSQTILLDINPKEKHGQAMAMWGMGVMLGPIIGPTLGGWLTEYYSWRWVFYINLPLGIAAFLGTMTFMREDKKAEQRKFDVLGFLLLSFFIGGLQMVLDRGESQDWFSSKSIVLLAALSCLSLYLFAVHIQTTNNPFVDPLMFKDRNYTVCTAFIFVIGMVLLASMALLPPFLQNLMGYPVVTTGLVLAPRGIGTMLSMVIVGRLIGRIDTRLLVLAGYSLMACSLYQMSLFTLSVPVSMIVSNGMLQGIGMGFIFVPLSTLAYATLPVKYRNDAAAIFSLVRNIGSGIGISIIISFLSRNIQISHSEIVAKINPFGSLGNGLFNTSEYGSPPSGLGLMLLDGLATREAATIAYMNNFRLMALVILFSAPLILLVKEKKTGLAPSEPTHAIAE